MNIICCVARVPDTAARIIVKKDGSGIEQEGVGYVMNPYDEFALEEALRTREKAGTGTVTVVSIGLPDSTKELRECLAKGADLAILIKADPKDLDSHAVAAMLAAEIRKLPCDVVFTGKQATDSDSAQVPTRLAGALGLPVVTKCSRIEISGTKAVAHREIEGGMEVVECPLPAVFSAEKGLNEPRYASLKGIMTAKKKEIREAAPAAVGSCLKVVRLDPPPPRPDGRIVGKGADAATELVRLLRTEAKVI
jgi:electron transfer flavoprotein beta subunit